MAYFTVLCTVVQLLVFVYSRVEPTASDIWIATYWATFFYISFCLKSFSTSERSYF